MPVLYGCSNLVTLRSNVFLLHVSFIPISSSLFSSLLQLLLTDRNPQTFHPFSVLFIYWIYTNFSLRYRQEIFFSLLCENMPVLLILNSLTVYDDIIQLKELQISVDISRSSL